MPTPVIPQAVFQQLVNLLSQPRSIDDLCLEMKVSRRTLYRYLTRLSDCGVPVCASLQRPTKYQIHQK